MISMKLERRGSGGRGIKHRGCHCPLVCGEETQPLVLPGFISLVVCGCFAMTSHLCQAHIDPYILGARLAPISNALSKCMVNEQMKLMNHSDAKIKSPSLSKAGKGGSQEEPA